MYLGERVSFTSYKVQNMLKVLFWGTKKSSGRPKERLISSKRFSSRRVNISKWAREAQKCELAISSLDNRISRLRGNFTRARREYFLAKRTEWQGKLKIALSHLDDQKSKLGNGLKHNLDLTVKRFS